MRLVLSSLFVVAVAVTAQAQTSKPPAVAPMQAANTAAPPTTGTLPAAGTLTAAAACTNPNALGIARTVEIDTSGGPGFGFDHYKVHDFLEPKEVVLTFDDGPQVNTTKAVLDALAHHCTKAIFFSIGKMALGLPEIIREVAKAGQTIGTHTWSHADVRKFKVEKEQIDEIERGISAVHRAVGAPISPFFRFPALHDTPETLKHLAQRNIAIFSTDIDSFDFKVQTTEHLVKSVMDKLEKKGKGIVLMHDIQPRTAKAIPALLDALKAGGYKIVFMKAKDPLKTVAEYDTLIEKDVKGLPAAGSERPTSSVVRTVPTTP
jgi:peptidoglycan/xylan/chitin deacetylase (PgdA/CDA1 family)